METITKIVDGEVLEVTAEELAEIRSSVAPPPPTGEELLAYAANRRWQTEAAGVEIGGVLVASDRDSLNMITAAIRLLERKAGKGESTNVRFKAVDGFVGLDLPTMIMSGEAIGDHIQRCFAREEEVAKAITAGTITTTAEIDSAFTDVAAAWPPAQE